MGLSPKVLNESICHVSGKACTVLLQDRLPTKAKRQLLYTPESSKEIAYALGFQAYSYFSRFFRKTEGLTPGAFKVHWEEKYQHLTLKCNNIAGQRNELYSNKHRSL